MYIDLTPISTFLFLAFVISLLFSAAFKAYTALHSFSQYLFPFGKEVIGSMSEEQRRNKIRHAVGLLLGSIASILFLIIFILPPTISIKSVVVKEPAEFHQYWLVFVFLPCAIIGRGLKYIYSPTKWRLPFRNLLTAIYLTRLNFPVKETTRKRTKKFFTKMFTSIFDAFLISIAITLINLLSGKLEFNLGSVIIFVIPVFFFKTGNIEA